MNRAERRRNKQYQNPKTLTLTDQGFKEAVQQETETLKRETINFAVNMMLAIMTITLHDRYGFGKKRLSDMHSYIQSQFDCVLADTVDAKELLELYNEIMNNK